MDIRPVGYVIGLLVAFLGAAMLIPFGMDLVDRNDHWSVFLEASVITFTVGAMVALACSNGIKAGLTLQQSFLMTTTVWIALPIFGALPFYLGATQANFTDAFFEAMSGLTTTGSTVFSGLDTLPRGLLLWRAMLQWFGGIGIVVVAMVFLPELRVGGMQIFRSEGFDTMGKILPRAAQISGQISVIYVGLTVICALLYDILGMQTFDAIVHALTTVSTGGFSSYDASFGTFSGPLEYVAVIFMILAALPFVRYVQMVNGHSTAIFKDTQAKTFMAVIAVVVLVATFVLMTTLPRHGEQAFREALFNITSIMSGTGYASADYMTWGPFLVMVFFFIGLIGGAAGSTACSVKIFRYQILFSSISAQIRRIHSPHGIFRTKFAEQNVSDEVLNSVMSFFAYFIVTFGLLSVGLSMTGLDFITAVSGAATALANVGPGLGDIIGPSGNFGSLNETAKWLLIGAMLVGRLEIMAVLVLFTVKFWRS